MPTIAELHTLSEQGQLAWVATANLRDLRAAGQHGGSLTLLSGYLRDTLS